MLPNGHPHFIFKAICLEWIFHHPIIYLCLFTGLVSLLYSCMNVCKLLFHLCGNQLYVYFSLFLHTSLCLLSDCLGKVEISLQATLSGPPWVRQRCYWRVNFRKIQELVMISLAASSSDGDCSVTHIMTHKSRVWEFSLTGSFSVIFFLKMFSISGCITYILL